MWSGTLFPQYGREPLALSDVRITFQCIAKNGDFQKLTPLEAEREGHRYFMVPLPDGSAKRYRLVGPRGLKEVDTTPGGDPG